MNTTHLRITAGIALGLLLVSSATAQRTIGNSNPNNYAASYFSPYMLFAANDATLGMELYRLDLLSMTTSLVADIHPGSAGSRPSGITDAPGSLGYLFAAGDGTAGVELWKTNGTAVGTSRLGDLAPGAASSFPDQLTFTGSQVLFAATTGLAGRELWRTDGTTVSQVLDIRPGPLGAEPRDLVLFQGLVYFTADDGVNGRELWKSDGTPGGTAMVKDLLVGGASSHPTELTVVRSQLLFAANSPTGGRELFVSDGTTAGTGMLKDIRPGLGSSSPSQLLSGPLLYFVADDGVHGAELWRSDGTASGTLLATDIRTGPLGSAITNLTTGPNLLEVWLVADDGIHGREIWRVSGGPATMVADIVPLSGSVSPTGLQRIDGTNRVAFLATDPVAGTEMWASDGTPGGTAMLADINPGARSSNPTGLKTASMLLGVSSFGALFAADDGSTGVELYGTRGTAGSTSRVVDLAPNRVGTQQPSIVAHADLTGTVTICIEGEPNALAGLGFDFAVGPGIPLPGVVGLYLLGGSPIINFLVLDGTGVACTTITFPPSFGTVDIVMQAFEVVPPDILLSDLATIGITSISAGSIGGGAVRSVGVYDDQNHLYEVAISLPTNAMPETGGTFLFFNEDSGEWANLTENGDWKTSNGLALLLKGSVPKWTGPVSLWFFSNDGSRPDFVWRSYC